MALQTSDLEKFVNDNLDLSKASDSEEVHVMTARDVDYPFIFDVNVPLGGAGAWALRGSVDANLAMDAQLFYKNPILSPIAVADVKGNLADGIAVVFNTAGVKGQAKVYTSDKWVYINLAATTVGGTYGPSDFKLFPLPVDQSTNPVELDPGSATQDWLN
ncbi:hypothetical protein MVEN_02210100 [Mycena venus]|uniref:Uncharacterized protein n=1 Tax=Mycena venus TaxID=2733690 RepID=A0A8H7CGK0_9AGAR|nr:hypothetical protein MVEN_02210100 [Mycena venus]